MKYHSQDHVMYCRAPALLFAKAVVTTDSAARNGRAIPITLSTAHPTTFIRDSS